MRVEFNENDARGQSNSSSPRRVAHEELGSLFEQRFEDIGTAVPYRSFLQSVVPALD
ncbi:MAG: hypothetical protein OXF03_08460 [Gammaproteobacteria bacterium]|nr:hypothetical protein [Gammaproteobacteria bacterium]MCY4341615.1 hypothetical protein [Gammaproteobacteria bacterium]